jgi:hypothetical protein
VIERASVLDAAFFAAAAALAWYLLAPIGRRAPVPPADGRAAPDAADAAVLRALEDLDLDWATGKLSDADYRAQRAALEDDAARLQQRVGGG